MKPTRSKFLIFERQKNLKEVIVFNIESQFNFEGVRAEVLDIRLVSKEDIAFIILGEGLTTTEKDKFYDLFIVNRLHETIPIYDISYGNEMFLKFNKHIILLNRENCVSEIFQSLNEKFIVDYKIPPQEFTRISLQSLQFLDKLINYVYIRLLSGRHLKLFQPYDKVTTEDVAKYHSKGVEWMYLKQNTYSWVLKQLQEQQKKIIQDPNAKIELKSEPDADIDTQILDPGNFINVDGLEVDFDKGALEEIPERIDLAKNKLKKNLKLKDVVNNLLSNKKLENFIEVRTNLVIFFACSIAQQLDWKSAQIMDKLIYAALVHDLALFKYPKILIYDAIGKIDQEPNCLNEKELEIYKNHVNIILSIIEKDSSAPKDAFDIIAQHHEKSYGGGFPSGMDFKRINFLSTVFNISLDIANALIRNSKLDYEFYLETKKAEYKGDFYRKGLGALQFILKKNKFLK